MQEKISGILEEIYKIDSGLRAKEKDIVLMLEESVKTEPNFEPDEEFVFELRKELLEKTRGAQDEKGKSVYKRIILIAGVFLVSFLIFILALLSYNPGRSGIDIKKVAGISSKVYVSEVGGNAFGVLSDLSGQQNVAKDSSSRGAALQGGSGTESGATGAASSGAVSSVAPLGMGGSVSTDSKVMPPYQPTYYSYVYKGSEFTQDQEKMNVLKRIMEDSSDVSADDIAGQIGSGLFNFNKLDNSKVAIVSFFEDREYGYRADIDFTQGYVSLYKNWSKWPNIYVDCKDKTCYDSRQIKAEDVPADDEIISTCNDFLDKYGVDLSAYGNPEIDRRFVNYYAKAADIVYPEEMTVVYPLQIDGKKVYESYGELSGLNVNFNIRDKKVSSLNNLRTNNYQGSAYDAETDIQEILAKAQNIDGNMPLAKDEGTDFKKVEVELDTPFLSYEHFWRYENNGQNSEFLVPCFVFPIKENTETENYYWRKQIVVPIIKDFLAEGNGGGITPMMTETGAANAAVKR